MESVANEYESYTYVPYFQTIILKKENEYKFISLPFDTFFQ